MCWLIGGCDSVHCGGSSVLCIVELGFFFPMMAEVALVHFCFPALPNLVLVVICTAECCVVGGDTFGVGMK